MKFLVFLKNFLYVKDLKINSSFDEHIVELSGGTISMGIIEIVRKHTLEQAMQQVRLEERAKAQQLLKAERTKNHEAARKMLKDGIPMETIVKYLGLSVEEIEELK